MSTIADMVVAASTMMQPASREREGSFEGGAGPRPPRRVRSMTAPPRQFSLLANDIQYRSYLPPAPRPSLFFSSLHPDSDLLLPPSSCPLLSCPVLSLSSLSLSLCVSWCADG